MTRRQVVGAVGANVLFWGFIALVVWTNGWAVIAALVLLVVFYLAAAGAGSVGR